MSLTKRYSVPILIDSFLNKRIISVSCGDSHALALAVGMSPHEQRIIDKEGTEYLTDVLAWGENNLGQITGQLGVERYQTPVVLPQFVGKKVLHVSCYRAKSCAVELGGNIYEWGGAEETCTIKVVHNIPEALEVQHGTGFTIVRTIDKVFFWGELRGKTRSIISEKKPTLVSGDIDIKAVSVGADHVLASDTSNTV